MSKFLRMMDVLDLFSGQATLMTAEEIAQALQVSRPTAFRYARELTQAGFLANYAGSYSLGARIITLDYRIRESDPVLLLARSVMHELAVEFGGTAVLCRMYNEEIINVHQEDGIPEPGSIIGRGRPLPLFTGAASKTMLAHMPRGKLRRLYERRASDPGVTAIGKTWEEFLAVMLSIREKGFYISIREVSELSLGIASPIALHDTGAVAVLSLVLPIERLSGLDLDSVGARVNACAWDIAAQLEILTGAGEAAQS